MLKEIKKGFTLIELMVVMTIIGILAALALTSFNTAQKNTRDTRRRSDLAQYRVVLEAFAVKNGGRYVYPYANNPPGNTEAGHGESCTSDSVGGLFRNNGPIIPAYLQAKIPDPIEKSDCTGPCPGNQCTYRYRAYTNGAKYFILAQQETGGFWVACSDGRAGRVSNWDPVTDDPGNVDDVGVDRTCNKIGT